MKGHYDDIRSQVHDSRVFGFFFDNDRSIFTSNFYIYVQLFGAYEKTSYELNKALIKFSDAEIETLSVRKDISKGQFFITDINFCQGNNGYSNFTFNFNSENLELDLFAADMELITSENIEYSTDQYLKTDWLRLLISQP